ncbi:carbohydrate ABC transporter permease [Clostridium felsineum]|uniref:Melibiose/raffinose/stachyose import permease protein MelC n=1 Tax=Clostridium felsineum TaxID=36839 RepID=A0A1S8MAA0_9CLOT|nr:carbohydrate ABC transporter permease [Clostridium felsineum]MCR3760495.1 carbohydrate ABC transporter permease [Clostridium felsineum]URZ02878.1 Melibiose/raffinose/stachyose import permease protein MelC [Clostridium felsineum]URZ08785.1 Melibiose/raffinose/stachyose import permease protein MelC [Clostridium felsineum]URZ09413.1 Melibiose/raffinose/stachyose import permease protein MelC [Clostridium felsineum]
MKSMVENKKTNILAYIILTLGALLLIFLPIYLTLIGSFKTGADTIADFFSFPKSLFIKNYSDVFSSGFSGYFLNTVEITVFSVILILLIVPLGSYAIVRSKNSKLFKCIYIGCLLGLFVPFQVFMLPLTTVAAHLHAMNKIGLIFIYAALAIPQTMFLYIGYMKANLPMELEEAASIDGCGRLKTYIKVVFPLLKPINATIIILNALWIWNDFLLPFLILGGDNGNWTLTLFQYNYVAANQMNYGPMFALYISSIVPIIIVYILFQRHIIGGMVEGSIK